jgi:uncharacterized protein YbaR (Trm112 family)
MHIELTEMLRCPAGHDEAFLVLATSVMKGRHVYGGILGCPTCKKEFPVLKGVVWFGAHGAVPPGSGDSVPSADALQALLGLTNAGGYVALVGSVCSAGRGLANVLGGTHVVGVNAPDDAPPHEMVSLVSSGDFLPLRKNSARGVVLGAECAHEPWLSEAVRVVLRGQRVIVLGGTAVPGLEQMAQSPEAWVGRKV